MMTPTYSDFKSALEASPLNDVGIALSAIRPLLYKRVFVYGSLRRGEYNHEHTAFKGAAEHVDDGSITGAKLYSLGPYPCIVRATDAKSPIIGEVYDLPIATFNWVDRMEIGAGYKREDVEVTTPSGIITAVAYFYPHTPEYGTLVSDGDWVKYLKGEAKQ